MAKRRDDDAFPWTSLPREMRLLVLEEVSRQKHRGWAVCAAVCREWQAIIEPRNFSHLALQTSCLDGLEGLVVRQRPLVRHICLNIELPRYACPTCRRNATMSNRSSTVFRKAVLRLFSVLSAWQPAGRLTLELSASSPSDSEHWFKNYCFGPGHQDAGAWTQQERAIRWHDPRHGWVDGQQVQAPDASAILRLFSPLCLTVPRNLPEVRAITGFLIRRQLRRELFPEVLKALWERLPRLDSVVYELWRVRRYPRHVACAYELASLTQDALPKHVKRVSIFKDFNDQLTRALDNATPYLGQHTEPTSPGAHVALAKAFSAKSPHLERLCISYMIDARQFFASCLQPPCTWDLLQSLTLTSSTLARTAPRQEVYKLLRDASLAALSMPQLESMVLWNAEPGDACAAIYQRRNTASGIATLTWRGTWDLELGRDVLRSWEKVAPGSCHLRLEKEVLRDVDVGSHGDAIHHLRLPGGVVDAASLLQIRQEGLMQRVA